jgi:hypothetical protein
VLTAAIATIFDLIPATRPFFAPGKGQFASGANFMWKVGFVAFVSHVGVHCQNSQIFFANLA